MNQKNPFNSLQAKANIKQSNNIIKFPKKEPAEYEIRFIIIGSDHSIPLPNIVIEEINPD